MNKKFIAMLFLMAPLALFAQNLTPKYAHFNSEEIVTLMPETKAMQARMEDRSQKYDIEMKRLQDEYLRNLAAYEADQATLLESVKQRREEDLQRQYMAMQEQFQIYQQEFEMKKMEEQENINKIVLAAVKQVGIEGDYVYIFDKSIGLPVFINEKYSTDVTSAVKAKLGIK